MDFSTIFRIRQRPQFLLDLIKVSRHSLNIHDRSDVAIVLFDTRAPKWQGIGLFFEAEAKQVTIIATMLKGLKLEFERMEEGLPNIKDFQNKRFYRVYQAKLKSAWITTDEEIIDGEAVDKRVPIEIEEIRAQINKALTIEKLPLAHWEEYKAIRLLALKTDQQAFGEPYSRPSEWLDEKWQERLKTAIEKKTSSMLFARVDGKLAGMIGWYRSEEDLLNHTANIWGVFVKPEHRGRGIAKSLMETILKELDAIEDIKMVILEVNSDQESAQKLYEKFGFVKTNESDQQLGDGKTHHVCEMQRSSNVP